MISLFLMGVLMADAVREAFDASFDEDVLREKPGYDIISVVDFWAPWCGPCVGFAPRFSWLAGQYGGFDEGDSGYGVNFYKLNVDDNPLTARRFKVRSIPTIIVFRNGKEVARAIGAAEAEELLHPVRGRLLDLE